jgi:DNA processing protein
MSNIKMSETAIVPMGDPTGYQWEQAAGLPIAEVRARLIPLGAVTETTPNAIVAGVFARAVWSLVAEPADTTAGHLVAIFGPAVSLELLKSVGTVDGFTSAFRSRGIDVTEDHAAALRAGLDVWRPRLNAGEAFKMLERAAAVGAQLVTPENDLWPAGFYDLGTAAPFVLWARGNVELLATLPQSIALVGARASTGYGEHVTMEAAEGLARDGVTIVSGAAYGIDGMAHRSALANEGATIAILAGGVDRFYPSGHDALLHRIVAGGLVVSEMPCGASPTKWRFMARNRLIAAAAAAVVVVEAGWRSGALNTAGHAETLGRPLGAVPGPVTSTSSAGCHRLIRESGARVVTNAAEMRELIPAAM